MPIRIKVEAAECGNMEINYPYSVTNFPKINLHKKVLICALLL